MDGEDRVGNARRWIAALRASHERLTGILAGLDTSKLTEPSYDDDWTIAQVLSHLGSGAEVFSLIVEAGVNGQDPPGREMFPAIWDAWNAKAPEQQAKDAEESDKVLVEQLEALDDTQLEEFRLNMFGMDLDAAGVVAMRESEHALHSWDIEVMLDPWARLAQDAVDLLIDTAPKRAPMAAKPIGKPLNVFIETTDPKRKFLFSLDETASFSEDASDSGGTVESNIQLPSEALIRLVAGRLDPDHTPPEVEADGDTLSDLRQAFPGF
jgi:uncharacterized protein (TIGR03083 family)